MQNNDEGRKSLYKIGQSVLHKNELCFIFKIRKISDYSWVSPEGKMMTTEHFVYEVNKNGIISDWIKEEDLSGKSSIDYIVKEYVWKWVKQDICTIDFINKIKELYVDIKGDKKENTANDVIVKYKYEIGDIVRTTVDGHYSVVSWKIIDRKVKCQGGKIMSTQYLINKGTLKVWIDENDIWSKIN